MADRLVDLESAAACPRMQAKQDQIAVAEVEHLRRPALEDLPGLFPRAEELAHSGGAHVALGQADRPRLTGRSGHRDEFGVIPVEVHEDVPVAAVERLEAPAHALTQQ